MSSESNRLARKLRRAMHQQERMARLEQMLAQATRTIQELRDRNTLLSKMLAERATAPATRAQRQAQPLRDQAVRQALTEMAKQAQLLAAPIESTTLSNPARPVPAPTGR